jgi:hypothetical protein
VKVYLATAGEYSDYRVLHAFARREDAEAYKLGEEVIELEVHDGPVEVRRWHYLNWRPGHPDQQDPNWPFSANPQVYDEPRDFDGNEKYAEHRWYESVLNVQGWDLTLVKKVYSEQRAQYLARKEGVS